MIFEQEWGNLPTWECLHAHKKLGLFSSVNVDDVKMLGKKQNIDSIWKTKQKDTDLEFPTPLIDPQAVQSKTELFKIIDNDTGG